MIIALDAGHGRETAGKRTPDGIREWTLNDIVLRGFQEEIVKFGVTVVRLDDATGNTDVTLLSRTNKAKSSGAKALISFHHNAFMSTWGDHGGTETYIFENRGAEALGNAMQNTMIKEFGLRNRGLKVGKVGNSANMHMCREVPFPACLVEVGFMDSNTDKIIRDASKGRALGIAMAKEFAKLYGLGEPTPAKPTITELAHEVIARKWGDDPQRSIKLGAAGHDAKAVQKEVNRILGSGEKPTAPAKPKPTPTPSIVPENGRCTPNRTLKIMKTPSQKGVEYGKQISGDSFVYDAYTIAEGFVWLRSKKLGYWLAWRVNGGETFGKCVFL